MSRRSVIIIGLTRQARFLMLPLPYAMASIGLAVLPFIWFKIMWWLLTYPLWWGAARYFSLRSPNGAIVFATVFDVTFDRAKPWPTSRKKGRTYANG